VVYSLVSFNFTSTRLVICPHLISTEPVLSLTMPRLQIELEEYRAEIIQWYLENKPYSFIIEQLDKIHFGQGFKGGKSPINGAKRRTPFSRGIMKTYSNFAHKELLSLIYGIGYMVQHPYSFPRQPSSITSDVRISLRCRLIRSFQIVLKMS